MNSHKLAHYLGLRPVSNYYYPPLPDNWKGWSKYKKSLEKAKGNLLTTKQQQKHGNGFSN